MDLRQQFATNLRRIRHQRRVSQEGLAHDAGVDRAYLSRVERAVTFVGLEIVGSWPTSWRWTRSSSSGDRPGRDPVRGVDPDGGGPRTRPHWSPKIHRGLANTSLAFRTYGRSLEGRRR